MKLLVVSSLSYLFVATIAALWVMVLLALRSGNLPSAAWLTADELGFLSVVVLVTSVLCLPALLLIRIFSGPWLSRGWGFHSLLGMIAPILPLSLFLNEVTKTSIFEKIMLTVSILAGGAVLGHIFFRLRRGTL